MAKQKKPVHRVEMTEGTVSYTHLMAKQKKPVHRVEMTEGKRNIIRQLLEEYDIENAEDIQDALKDLLGGTIKDCLLYTSRCV